MSEITDYSLVSESPLMKLKKPYASFRFQLSTVSNEIESMLFDFKSSLHPSITKPRLRHIPKIDLSKILSEQIKNYSASTEAIDNKIQAILSFEGIDSKEGALSMKRSRLSQLESENASLLSVYFSHMKGMKDLQHRHQVSEEAISHLKTTQNLKQSIKLKKKMERATESAIKSQNKQINALKKKCQIIKENISYKKRNDIKLLITLNREDVSLDSRINKLKAKVMSQEELIASENREYSQIIHHQQKRINQIADHILALTKQVNSLNKEMKMNAIEKKVRRRLQLSHNVNCVKLQKRFKGSSRGMSEENDMKVLRYSSIPNKKMRIKQEILCSNKGKAHSLSFRNMEHKPFKLRKVVKIIKQPPACFDSYKVIQANDMYTEIESLKHDIQKALRQSENRLCEHSIELIKGFKKSLMGEELF